jgi:uncharacterized protein (DUF2132 family)
MELEQRHRIKLLYDKGFKLEKLAAELSNTYGWNADAPLSINIGYIK